MEAGGKDTEEETLQTAFKKLRVDAESVVGAVSASEGTRGTTSRVCLENNGTKPKLSFIKDMCHGFTRKSFRGVCRSQRRRRSKSPILHPPRFIYCSSSTALSPSGGRLKPADVALPTEGRKASFLVMETPPSLVKKTPSSLVTKTASSLVTKTPSSVVKKTPSCSLTETPSSLVTETPSPLDGAGNAPPLFGSCVSKDKDSSDRSDFAALSDSFHTAEARPDLSSVEAYSFSGLRHVLSECERSREASRTLSSGASTGASTARSCSEQARGFVDDVTIEDLSGYMENYLYIPKKMSHMAEMMYT